MATQKTARCFAGAARAGLALLSTLVVAGAPAFAGARYSFDCFFPSVCGVVYARFTLERDRDAFRIVATERAGIERAGTGCPSRGGRGFDDKNGIRAQMGEKTPSTRTIRLRGINAAGDAATISIDRKSRITREFFGKVRTKFIATMSFERESALSNILGSHILEGYCLFSLKD